MFRQFFAPGDNNRHRTAGSHFLEALFHKIGFDELRPHLGGDAAGKRKVARIPGHLFTDPGHRQGWDAVAVARIHQLDDVVDRLVLIFAADIDLRRHRADVQAQGILHRHRHALVGKLPEHRVATRGAQHHRLVGRGRHGAAQNAAGTHQHVGFGKQRRNGEIDTFQPGGWPLEVAMIESQHDRAIAGGVEDARQPRLHPPVQRSAALQRKGHILLRSVEAKVLTFFDVV